MSKTILCADDSKTMQTVAEITFRATEWDYVGARSVDEALQKAKASKPVLILADAVMPGKTGYDLCRAIKSDPMLADVPVMLMCGNSQPYDDAKGAQVGCDGHVTKPWDTQVMLDKVVELLDKVASEGVVGVRAGGSPAAAAPPSPPPAPVATPRMPDPKAARTATIMGMPSIKMPPSMGGSGVPGVTPVKPPGFPATAAPSSGARVPSVPSVPKASPIARPPATPQPAAAPKPAAPPAAPKVAPKPMVAPAKPMVAPKPITRAPAPVMAPKPIAAPVPVAAAAPVAAPRPVTASPSTALNRPPLIKGQPKRRPAFPRRPIQELPRAMAAAQAAGLEPTGPEMEALMKISHDVVERIVWEVVPELAELIIRENLDKLTAKTG